MSRLRVLFAAALGSAAGSIVAYSVYRSRRRWLGRLIGLPPSIIFDVIVDRGVTIPLPDGVTLDAVHYRPVAGGALPAILIRTPYGLPHEVPRPLRAMHDFPAQRFAERGYHVLIVSTRGRFGSGGEFTPFVNEAADGRAVLDWIAQQSWFGGALGTFGASYVGYTQWAVAADAPPYLKALVPLVTGANLARAFLHDGAFNLDTMLRWLLVVAGPAYEPHQSTPRWLYFNSPAADQKYLQPAFNHLPLETADEIVAGQPVDWYRRWLQYPDLRDPHWQTVDHRRNLPRVNVPVHLIGGWYDIFLRETLADYAALKAAGHQPYLTIDQGVHADPRHLPLAVRDGLAWFDTHLKNQPHRLRAKPVRVELMGANEWRDFDEWPPASTPARFYLHDQHQLLDIEPTIQSIPDRYTYDPADPTPAIGGPLMSRGGGPVDNRRLESRSDVITFTSPPLDAPLDVMGEVTLELYVRSSVPHTDFFGRLCDVYPDGRSINICDGLLRVEPGVGEAQPDGSLKITVGLWATAQRFKRGHRLRLQVSSGAHPRWLRNYGTGEPIAEATKLLPADQTIYHDRAHPSVLILPMAA